MKNLLKQLGNIPVSSSTILSLYPDIRNKGTKIATLEKNKQIIRLKRDIFIVNPEETGLQLSTGLIANHLTAPSYVSMQSALRYYGLIPEAVYSTQSMTFKATKKFHTPIGDFTYQHISRDAYHIGLTQIKENGVVYIMATPEKALCDLIANTPAVYLYTKKAARLFLQDDLRFDIDRLPTLRISIFQDYARVGKKSTSILTLIKLLDHEQRISQHAR